MLYLRALGGLSLSSDTVKIPASAHQRRRLAVLIRLAASGPGGVSRDRLLAYLWGENPAEHAQHALDQLLYATRRDLGKHVILSEGSQLRLNRDLVWSDVAEFEVRMAEERWEAAAALYGGPFLDGVHLAGGPELERWAEALRFRLEQSFVQVLEKLAREATERGDLQAALQLWHRRAATDRLSAHGARGLVQTLVLTGDGAQALQYARTYGALVRQELGVEPDPEILELAKQVRAETDPRVGSADPQASPTSAPQGRSPDSPKLRIPIHQRHWYRLSRWQAVLAMCAVGLITGSVVVARAVVVPREPADTSSLAVLPFEDLSADGSATYLGDGMSEELIHALSQLPGLNVAARTSAFVFKNRHEDVRKIARSLGVTTVLEGSVRREGNRLRVTAQLVDAATGYHLWSGRFDGQLGDALSIQDEIAGAIARTLRPQLAGRVSPPARAPPASAYHAYLEGRYAWNQRTEVALRRAVRFFEKSIAEDPRYALAYAGLSDAYDALADGGFDPAESTYEKAEAAARRAIALQGTLADAYASLGHLKFHRWDWAGAERDLQHALKLNPGYSAAYSNYAMPLVMQGRFDEGLAMMQRAQELDPLALNTRHAMGWLLFLAGRHEDAIEQLRVVIAMDSTHVSSHARLGLSLVERREYTEGIASLEQAVALGGDYYRSALPMLGYAYARAGRREHAEGIRVRTEQELKAGRINPYYAAALMAVLDDTDRAFDLLEDASLTNRGCLIDLGVDPMMNTLRGDARYTSLVRALGIRIVAPVAQATSAIP